MNYLMGIFKTLKNLKKTYKLSIETKQNLANHGVKEHRRCLIQVKQDYGMKTPSSKNKTSMHKM